MKYQWIFFDADETLFSFDGFAGLKRMFAAYGVDFQAADFDEFQQLNKPLWVQYQNAEISAQQLQTTRFERWGKRLGKSAAELNRHYLLAMAEICRPLEGVTETLQYLAAGAKLAIITNGFTLMQQLRLQNTGLQDYFEFITVSEEVGIAKPDARIFAHSLQRAQVKDKSKVLMVGDTLQSDIQGGINAGLDTCWLAHRRTNETAIQPAYTVNRFAELAEVVKASR